MNGLKSLFLASVASFSCCITLAADPVRQGEDKLIPSTIDRNGKVVVQGQPSDLQIDKAPRKTPRKHVFQFGKMALPLIALSQPEEFVKTFTGREAEQAIKNVWDNVGAKLPAEQRMSSAGLKIDHVSQGDFLFITITFPAPEAPNELFYSMCMINKKNPEQLRIFGLESALKNQVFPKGTVVVEWDKKGRYTWEVQAEPNAASLQEAILRISDRKVEVRTFTDLRPMGWFAQ